MQLPDFVYRFIGRRIADQLNLQEDSKMDGTKPWYKSQTIWAGIVAMIRGIYQVAQLTLPLFTNVHLPEIPPTADAILGSVLGATVINGRYTADTKIG